MTIRITQFRGAIPRLRPHLIPQGAAQVAINTDTTEGGLQPIQAPLEVHDFGGPVTDFVLHNGDFLPFTSRVWAAPGPVKQKRLYYAEEGDVPKVRNPLGVVYDLGLDYPMSPITVTLNSITEDPDDPLPRETVYFVYTWVTPWGEESLPSPVSVAVDIAEGQTALLSYPDNLPPSGSRIDRMRVYMTQTSAAGTTAFYFMDELNTGVASSTYDPALNPLQEELPSTDYDPPPDDLVGLTTLPNGFMAGFTGKTLCFSEPWQPHAWPIKYQLVTDYEIVGLGVTGNLLAILTTGTPYLCQGSHPENMQLERMDVNLPCLSGAGVVDMGGTIAYPSPEGLVAMTSGSPTILTGALFTRKQWEKLNPSTFDAAHHAGRYVFYHTPTGETDPVLGIIDPSGPAYIQTDLPPGPLRYDLESGDLYMVNLSGKVKIFDDISMNYRNLTWRSGEFFTPAPASYGVCMVEGEELESPSNFSISIYRDGALILTSSIMNDFFRLPAGLGSRWEVEIYGKVRVDRFALAGEPSDLMQG